MKLTKTVYYDRLTDDDEILIVSRPVDEKCRKSRPDFICPIGRGKSAADEAKIRYQNLPDISLEYYTIETADGRAVLWR